MTKGVKICVATAVMIFVLSLAAALILYRPSSKNTVVIMRDNEVLYEFDLTQCGNKNIRIEYTGGGYNEVRIENGEIFISDADCPDKTCMKTGKLKSVGIPIVCLPHHLVIRYNDEVTP